MITFFIQGIEDQTFTTEEEAVKNPDIGREMQTPWGKLEIISKVVYQDNVYILLSNP